MKDVVNNREALELLRSNSQLVRQIREIHDRVDAIERQYGLAGHSTYSQLSHEFKFVQPLHGDIDKKRALNNRLRKDLIRHRNYLTALRNQIRSNTHPDVSQRE